MLRRATQDHRRALRKEHRDAQRILTRLLRDAEPEVSGWAPDPTGGHDLRYIQNGVKTGLVANGAGLAIDSSISDLAGFDWDGPGITPRTAAPNLDWLMAGAYVYRCRSTKTFWASKPTWYTPVWVAGRKVYRVSVSARTVIHLESRAALLWQGGMVTRDGSAVGTIDGRWLRDVDRQSLARHETGLITTRPTVRLPDGTVIASGYWRPNRSDHSWAYDDTFVLTVTVALTDPLATLVLVWGLTMPNLAHAGPAGGGG